LALAEPHAGAVFGLLTRRESSLPSRGIEGPDWAISAIGPAPEGLDNVLFFAGRDCGGEVGEAKALAVKDAPDCSGGRQSLMIGGAAEHGHQPGNLLRDRARLVHAPALQ
jgi:hypothetical protein